MVCKGKKKTSFKKLEMSIKNQLIGDDDRKGGEGVEWRVELQCTYLELDYSVFSVGLQCTHLEWDYIILI